MTNKILWGICGCLFLIFIFLVFKNQLTFLSWKKSKNISGENISKTFDFNQYQLAKLPIKNNNTQDPQILSKSSYLIDVSTFYPLYAHEESLTVPIASTTKIATALVVLENHSDKLNEVVAITPEMINVEDTRIGLRTNEKITVESLLNGLLIKSGNDTAYALAEYFEGKDKFVAEMNTKAEQIGLKDTRYQDPAGLDDTGRSTAHDLAIISAYALRNKKFAEIVKTPQKTITSIDGEITHELENSNRMMQSEDPYFFPFTIGIKTGFTNDAGHVLVSAAEQNGHCLLSVVLNTNENTIFASAKESKKLLEWGFANWTW